MAEFVFWARQHHSLVGVKISKSERGGNKPTCGISKNEQCSESAGIKMQNAFFGVRFMSPLLDFVAPAEGYVKVVGLRAKKIHLTWEAKISWTWEASVSVWVNVVGLIDALMKNIKGKKRSRQDNCCLRRVINLQEPLEFWVHKVEISELEFIQPGASDDLKFQKRKRLGHIVRQI